MQRMSCYETEVEARTVGLIYFQTVKALHMSNFSLLETAQIPNLNPP